MTDNTLIRVEGLTKRFGHVTALDGFSFAATAGEIVALVGDNGCGKSTFLKILCGVLKPDAGEISVQGIPYKHYRVDEARALGVSAMYQDLALDPMRDVTGNIFLGAEHTRWGFWLDKKRMRREADALLRSLRIQIPDQAVSVNRLSGGQRQSIALARAIHRQTPIMLFDEPTAAMGVAETEKILQQISSLRDAGVTVILISHNLFQVFRLADRIVVMALGQAIANVTTKESSPTAINQMIIERSRRL